MSERELFNEILDYFVIEYDLEIERPYNDDYISISQNDKHLGGFNYSGYNLLRNLTVLCSILNDI